MRTEDHPTAANVLTRARPPAQTRAAPAPSPPPDVPDLPGCRPISLRRRDLDTWDDRFEYWDGATETAWVVRDPTGVAHEQPAERLVALCTRIADARGAPIECYGTADLERRDEHGQREKILQADNLVYVYPLRARLPEGGAIVVGRHDLPDVLLEVDYTTDVRPWKLGMYESWGFPEVWVEVPRQWTGGRRRVRTPGLTIHVLEGGRYRESQSSRAFPGWRARAIHNALNEVRLTDWTCMSLKRVGRTLGERDGTGPDDDPWLRSFRKESRAEGRTEGLAEGWAGGRTEGRAEGRAEGLAEGEAKGRTEGLAEGRAQGLAEGEVRGRTEGKAESLAKTVREMLRLRGIAVSEGFPANAPGFAEAPEEAAVAAALACDSEEDFRARIRGG